MFSWCFHSEKSVGNAIEPDYGPEPDYSDPREHTILLSQRLTSKVVFKTNGLKWTTGYSKWKMIF